MRAGHLMRPLLLSVATLVAACTGDAGVRYAVQATGGSPERGREYIKGFGCGACHEIPGLRGPRGTVGPPLAAFGRRSFIAGAEPNTPENLVRWIVNPQDIEPGTAMPNLGLSEPVARDVAAYLYTLR